MSIDWDMLALPIGTIAKVLLVYALPWGFAFEASNILVDGPGSWDIITPGENALERVGVILLYGLSLFFGGIFWAFSYTLIIAALHQGVLVLLSRRLALNKGIRFAGHLMVGILTGVALFYYLEIPGHLLWAGFYYYTPPLALPCFISCIIASICAGLYSLRRGIYAS